MYSFSPAYGTIAAGCLLFQKWLQSVVIWFVPVSFQYRYGKRFASRLGYFGTGCQEYLLPGNTILTVLVLNLAKVMNLFESVFVLYNNAVYSVSDVYSTAVGLFRSMVGCFLVLVCNRLSKKIRGRGIV